MSDKCIHCHGSGGHDKEKFDPSLIEPVELRFRAGQEPEITIKVSDWNGLIMDWLRMKEALDEKVKNKDLEVGIRKLTGED